ncbi:hypothetical protein DL93DRAFT_2066334 [Clavulina sp. PMI_390]|nr:hypothetical protein DL93DRAFT_2066334 [Clavulina sp. PMI_390]
MSFSTQLLKSLVPDSSILSTKTNLYQTLSRLPNDGVGSLVRQKRWDVAGRPDTYWQVTRVRLKNEGKNGKAWGRFVYKGKAIHTTDQPIPGALKYTWREGSGKEVAKSTA